MLLAFDVGNTTTAVGAYGDGALAARWRIHTSHRRSADEYAVIIRELLATQGWDVGAVAGVSIACVASATQAALVEMCRAYLHCDPLIVTAETDLGLRVSYEPPHSLGADRIVNAFAATCKYGMPVIVADLGTATKLDAVSAHGEYLGGAILAGVGVSMEALFMKTAKLPQIELADAGEAIGRNTIAAMRSGILYGTVAAVDGLIQRIKAEMGPPAPKVLATGGYAYVLADLSTQVQVIDDQLTLDGLYLAYQRLVNRRP